MIESEIIGAVRPFTVAMDYDDTFSTCPETWGKVIDVLRAAGASVVCITSRSPETEIYDFPGSEPIVYCSGEPKAEVAHRLGLEIKVWIDDQPEYIGINPERAALKRALGMK